MSYTPPIYSLRRIDDEYFCEVTKKMPHQKKATTKLYRDVNGDVLSLGKEEAFAKHWLSIKNCLAKLP